jgi:hypothetical protein
MDNTWIALGEGEAWLSEGGSLWRQGSIGNVAIPPWIDPQLTRGLPHPIGAARLGDRWFAVSRLDGGVDAITPVVFVSADGLTWTHLVSSKWWGYVPTGLASNGKVLVATNAGSLAGQGSVFVSNDGIEWTEHLASGGPAAMVDIYAGPDAMVAVGYRWSDETLESPVAWVSSDGFTWAEADPIDAARGTTPRAVGRTASGSFVMLTTVTTFPGGCSENTCLTHVLGAWYSTDGQQWRKADFPKASAPFGSYREIDLLPISGGLLAIVSTKDGSAAWVTSDGIAWKDAEFTSADLSVSAGASNGGSALLFGASGVVVTGKTP